MDRLSKEVLGWDSETATYKETKATKVAWEECVVMLVQLNNEKLGPVWRQTEGPDRKKSSQLMMPIPRGGARAEGRLVVAGMANQIDSKAISQDNIVVGRIEEDG